MKYIFVLSLCLMTMSCSSLESNLFSEENPEQSADYSDMEDEDLSLSPDSSIDSLTLSEFNLPEILNAQPPVNSSTLFLASAFGPRLQSGRNNRYDFHRGIDLAGSEGDSIFAIAGGTIYKAYRSGSSSFPGGGNVVILRHNLSTPILFHDTRITRIYSLYFHLKSFSPAVENYIAAGRTTSINKGDVIGLMGHTGNASFDHVHFEVRLQTPCSLEYQLQNPTSSCAGYGFDPHINPWPLFETGTGDYELSVSEIDEDTVVVNYSADHDHADIDGIQFIIYSASDPTNILAEDTLSYNRRTSFDASSTADLDNPDLGSFYLSPAPFGTGPQDGQIIYSIDPTLRISYDDLEMGLSLFNARGEAVDSMDISL